MWTELFKEKIRKQKVEQKKIAQIMGVSETAFYTGISNNSMKFQNVLKVYTYFGWDLNELKGETAEFVSESNNKQIKETKIKENVSIHQEDMKGIYEAYIKNLQGQLEFLQEIIRKKHTDKGEVFSQTG